MPKKTTPKRTLILLDAHAILHRAYHALPDFSSQNGEPTGALYGVVTMLLKIIEDFSPDMIAACFDLPDPTYRHEAFAEYKGKRAKTDDELIQQINRSRDIFSAFGIPIYEMKGFEADDVLGTIAKKLESKNDIKVIIASGDMDTLQCVDGDRVQVFTLKKGIKDTIIYNETAVRERFGFGPELIPDYKGLRGDASDNIPGIAGIGEKTASELITNFGSLENIYKTLKKDEAVLKKVGIKPRVIQLLKDGEEEAMFSKMLATIRTDAPVEHILPETVWHEEVDVDALEKLFSELSFRTLGERVRKLIGKNGGPVIEPAPKISPEELEKTAIALWLLESETTNPTYEDILSYGRARGLQADFKTIQETIFSALDAHNLRYIYEEIELPLRDAIKEMERNGVLLDISYFEKLSREMHKELEKIAQNIYQEAGQEFNINSPKQLAEILYDVLELKPKNAKKTAGGQRTTRESELEKLQEEHTIIPYILKYREVQKLVSTYVDPLPKLVDQNNRLHPNFLQTGTTTGRLACKDPNLQNIPTRSEASSSIRRGFVAQEGFQLVSIDYSQIELRVAAFLSEDPKLLDIFRRGEDVHTGVAIRVFGVSAEDVTSEMRRKAKVINFGILYGMGVNALRTNLGGETTRQEAQEFLNAYFQTFTRLAEYLEEVRTQARKEGYTKTMFGRRRYFPAINSGVPHLRAQAERMAINAPVQGTAADIMRIAMNEVYSYTQKQGKDKVQILLQVHDELLFEIATEAIESQVPKLVDIMESIVDEKDTHGIPISVSVEIGNNWSDLKKYQIE